MNKKNITDVGLSGSEHSFVMNITPHHVNVVGTHIQDSETWIEMNDGNKISCANLINDGVSLKHLPREEARQRFLQLAAKLACR